MNPVFIIQTCEFEKNEWEHHFVLEHPPILRNIKLAACQEIGSQNLAIFHGE